MKPVIKPLENTNSKKDESVVYTVKGSQQMPDEIKKVLISMSAVLRMELIAHLTKVNAFLKTGKGSKQELGQIGQKYINLLRSNKGDVNGFVNRNISSGSSITRRMDGPKKR